MISAIPTKAIPTTDEACIAWLQLARCRRVGPTTFLRLIRQFGRATDALDALPEIAAEAGEKSYRIAPFQSAEAEWSAGLAKGARVLFFGAPDYPTRLLDLTDPPPILWAKGSVRWLKRPAVALVGARNASAVGQRMATRLAEELGQAGYVVVSGLARGIDRAAHEAALATGTVAVQAGGVDIVYPRENLELTKAIGEKGLRLSEMPIGMQPQARHFPRRNRIISGLADAVVVVEGAARSGSLITARNALDQGRDVMAVPGHPLDPRATGCNILIRDGALLVRSARDVIEALGQTATEAEEPAAPDALPLKPDQATDLPDRILSILNPSPIPEDALIRATGAPAQEVLATLAELSVLGRIDRQPGGLICRAAC